ncbi:protein PSK SIMULATOR 1-like [Typha latifolia]|uniref:protein PSK SIMULATOR 1-like n=1 Tax=Typha latifolia TaxID=4733 RepID=UPI003C2C6D4C
MGAVCSRGSAVDRSPSELSFNVFGEHDPKPFYCHGKVQRKPKTNVVLEDKQLYNQPFSFSENGTISFESIQPSSSVPKELQLSRDLSQNSRPSKSKPATDGKSPTAKVLEVSSRFRSAGTTGLGKAVEVLDAFSSSMTSLNSSGSFVSGAIMKGNKISVLAFEVANTICKGSNLMQSLSTESIKHLKEVVLRSEGVQHLISKDMDELLRLAAADKRQELDVFSKEVVRFGNRCKDPQWHNLDRYFAKLESEITPQKQLKETATGEMQYLVALVRDTAELYHEMHALDRFEQDYRRKPQEEENSVASQRGDTLQILRQELKSQRKHVRSLKKKSLWSKILEEVMEKLVDVVHVLYLEIHNAFGSADGVKPVKGSNDNNQKLGSAGLALHYANIITQIDTLVSRSSSVPPNTRDALYQGLPPSIKSALRNKLQSFEVVEELTVPRIRCEMEKTLQWLVPIANNTTRAHHGFGWVGEWANTGTEMNQRYAGQPNLIKIETLYHADKEKTEAYMLDLVVWLHHLINQSRPGNGGINSPIRSPVRSPKKKRLAVSLVSKRPSSPPSMLTKEDQEMPGAIITLRRLTPGISKSQELVATKSRLRKHDKLSKSCSHLPNITQKELPLTHRLSMDPRTSCHTTKSTLLDAIEGVILP